MIAARHALLLAKFFILAALPGCGGQLMSPPAAQIGDASITVTVKLTGPGRFPAGSDVTIILADISGFVSASLAGDTLTLSEPDRSVRITLPADKHKIGRCQTAGVCGVYVTITKAGKTLFRSASPAPYTLFKKNVTVPVRAV